MSKKIAILQSNYIPWKGYFDLVNSVDEFIIYDDVQYTKNDWRNRNLIKTSQGSKWLTIPVRFEKLDQLIEDTKVADCRWQKKHWMSICQSYSKTKNFKDYKEVFEYLYLDINTNYLSEINYNFLIAINKILGISTKISRSREFVLPDNRIERLIEMCKVSKATEYISGPAAKNYLDESLFKEENIKVKWMDYSNYKEYDQLFPPFDHNVTILDLIFNEGHNVPSFMKSFDSK